MSDSEDYKVVNGVIVSRGKFEGEPSFMPTIWDMVLGSMADESLHDGTTAYYGFKIDEKLSAVTGMPAQDDAYLVVWSDSQGFVNHMVLNHQQMMELEPSDFDSPDIIDADFDGVTQEWYGSCLPVGFDDAPWQLD